MTSRVDFLIQQLQLLPHPEGGYYREVYRSENCFPNSNFNEFPSGRSFGTSIYFLLENKNFSAFHRIKSDEIWHFYEGCALEIISIDPNGNLEIQKLGNHPEENECFQHTVKAGNWFAARLLKNNSFALVGCTVAPGFDFIDFELPSKEKLIHLFPQHSDIIQQLSL